MSTFIRLNPEQNKAKGLRMTVDKFRKGASDVRIFHVDVSRFLVVPGTPFAYWVSEGIQDQFANLTNMTNLGAETKCGAGTLDDFRFLRLWWETDDQDGWVPFPKGGVYSPWYGEVPLEIWWRGNGSEVKQFVADKVGSASRKIQAQDFYFRKGLTWPRRTTKLSVRPMPSGCIFADKGPAAFVENDDTRKLLALCAVMNSIPFGYLVSVQLGTTELARSFEVGLVQNTPIPQMDPSTTVDLSQLARRSWSLKRLQYATQETSRSFLLPRSLISKFWKFSLGDIVTEISNIQSRIDQIALSSYRFDYKDEADARNQEGVAEADIDDESLDDDIEETADDHLTLFSWCVGVAFGRFDWRLAIGERSAPPEPDPFDPLPAKSPGMLPDGAAPFHPHPGILVYDLGHPHDLPRLIEDVLATVNHPAPENTRRWLQRDFFSHHLKQYSKSRRKAPIYWPLSTASGGYTLWLYYAALTDQTLYTAANDFVGPKLEETSRLAAALRTRTNRSRDEEHQLEQLQDLEAELQELQDELLRLAPTWKPNHDDGVQITAAPLWRLFRYRSWQTVLKETWEKLAKGDYDWSHLAMTYWPVRVRDNCRTDKSLAIAHDLEDLCQPPAKKPGTGRRGGTRGVEAS